MIGSPATIILNGHSHPSCNKGGCVINEALITLYLSHLWFLLTLFMHFPTVTYSYIYFSVGM